MALPTPADVKALPLGAKWITAFAAVPDENIQKIVNSFDKIYGSAEVRKHTQRDEAILYATAHKLALLLIDQGAVSPGGGGGFDGLSSVKLDGAGTKSWAISAWTPEDLNDYLKRRSPFSTCLHMILDTFPPGIAVAGVTC